MGTRRLDDIDKQLLALLHDNARYAATDLARRIGVSDNTVHNRMRQLEDEGVITGYRTVCDYDQIGLTLHYLIIATTRIVDRGEVATQALEIPQVVDVTELMTGQGNLHIKAIGVSDEDITRVAQQLDELRLEIIDEHLIRTEHHKSFDYGQLETLLDE
ncbi:ArsR family transcriptional regulator [Salinigranum rubrum]|uniref:ArsR family transcriptional regulator n=1 Tax=Salinigranum rubrum TaxID=755307 RepID=A0A2I8VGN6_9EURY|nr:winged helix-turn-helix transcriptional regulator [Salinigranum rubrum]AUV81081.1 ArsR family transcriptional regulator [Salinigranum rubrum]